MNLGTLRITLPTGQAIEVPLDQPSLAVGRHPANDVVLDHASIADVHALVTVRPDGAAIIDQGSAVGTFVNGVRLDANTPWRVAPGDQIRFGLVEGAVVAARELVAPPSIAELGNVTVRLSPPEGPVEPGWVEHAAVTIENEGTAPVAVSLSIEGLPAGWWKLSRETVQVDAGGREFVRITFQPPREAADVAGDHDFTLEVRSSATGNAEAGVHGRIRILGLDNLVLAIVPERSSKPVEVVLQSHARAPRAYVLAADDLEQSLTFELEPSSLALLPGAEARARLAVKAGARPVVGRNRAKRYQVTATPGDPAVAPSRAIGEHVVRPVIPPWLIGLALAAIAVALVAYPRLCGSLGLPGCPGMELAFSGSPLEVNPGAQSILTWSVEGAEAVELLPAPGPVDASGSLVVNPGQSTAYTLRAVDARERSEERTVIINVVGTAPTVSSFTIEPASYVRGQTSSITLSWAAPGADTVTISGVEGVFPSAGSTSTSAPGESTEYTLVARNAIGSASATAVLSVTASGCVVASPGGDAANLYEGPGTDYRVIAQLAPGSDAEPIGRNSEGDWALVTTSNRDGWLPRSQLSCQPSGPVEGPVDFPTVDPDRIPTLPATTAPTATEAPLPTETLAPTETPTPTETATATGTPTATETPED